MCRPGKSVRRGRSERTFDEEVKFHAAQWIVRRPWDAIRATMQQELADPRWDELCVGTAFIAAGCRGLGPPSLRMRVAPRPAGDRYTAVIKNVEPDSHITR